MRFLIYFGLFIFSFLTESKANRDTIAFRIKVVDGSDTVNHHLDFYLSSNSNIFRPQYNDSLKCYFLYPSDSNGTFHLNYNEHKYAFPSIDFVRLMQNEIWIIKLDTLASEECFEICAMERLGCFRNVYLEPYPILHCEHHIDIQMYRFIPGLSDNALRFPLVKK